MLYNLTPISEEDYLEKLAQFDEWNRVGLVLDPEPNPDGLGDSFSLYIEVNPWQHYSATFTPSAHKWEDVWESAQDLAYREDPDTFNDYR